MLIAHYWKMRDGKVARYMGLFDTAATLEANETGVIDPPRGLRAAGKQDYSDRSGPERRESQRRTEGMGIAQEFVDVETARKSGREGFGQMLAYLKKHRRTCCTILVEKTDRLYRNLTDWATIDELGIVIHFVKENVIISPDSRSADQFLHGIKVLMARNYSQNLGEENHKGHDRKSAGIYPSFAPIGYQNVDGPGGKRVITPDQDAPTVRLLFDLFATGGYSLKRWSKKHMPRASRCAVGASKPASFTCSSGSASIAGTLTGMATPTRELTNPS